MLIAAAFSLVKIRDSRRVVFSTIGWLDVINLYCIYFIFARLRFFSNSSIEQFGRLFCSFIPFELSNVIASSNVID